MRLGKYENKLPLSGLFWHISFALGIDLLKIKVSLIFD